MHLFKGVAVQFNVIDVVPITIKMASLQSLNPLRRAVRRQWQRETPFYQEVALSRTQLRENRNQGGDPLGSTDFKSFVWFSAVIPKLPKEIVKIAYA